MIYTIEHIRDTVVITFDNATLTLGWQDDIEERVARDTKTYYRMAVLCSNLRRKYELEAVTKQLDNAVEALEILGVEAEDEYEDI